MIAFAEAISKRKLIHLTLLLLYVCLLVWSAISPRYPLEWVSEVAPLTIGIIILIITYRRFTFTTLSYVLIFLFSALLLIGAHYSYNYVPVFNGIKSVIDSSRNDFDRLVHVFEGVIPAIMAREIFIRKGIVRKRWWLFAMSVAVALAISAAFELVEWSLTIATGVDVVGAQGDQYDTQIDMFLALVGATISLLVFRGYQNRILRPYLKKKLNG